MIDSTHIPPSANKFVYHLKQAINKAQYNLLKHQHIDGYWCFELEADCSITADYIIMMHYIGEIDYELQLKLVNYLKRCQSVDGGYPLFTGGRGDVSCSVKVYFALKLAGSSMFSHHMLILKCFILNNGGASKCNVLTRITLAMFDQLPWRGVPYIPVEIMLFSSWSPFHLDKVSYWSRVVMVPLFILCTLKATAINPIGINIVELFVIPPDKEQHYFPENTLLSRIFLRLDKIGRCTRFLIPNKLHKLAIDKAKDWFIERLNGEDGLGGIFPAMVASYEAMLLLGIPKDHHHVITARKAIDKLLVIKENEAYCQPCLSPVWDTALTILSLQEADKVKNKQSLTLAYDWLKSKQLSLEPGDWRNIKPKLKGGGWAFQFANPHYPDVDDTAIVAYAMSESNITHLNESIHRAADWIVGMQSKNGGYGAFDVDNIHHYLNEIPFADHGALLDPPTADVSARCLMLLGKLCKKHPVHYTPALNNTINYIRSEQEPNGSWFGRWGTNYIYGTWSVLLGLEQTNISKTDSLYTKPTKWLKSIQKIDGGWGESNYSYYDNYDNKLTNSTSFQTAWAILALIAAGEYKCNEVKLGITYLISTQQDDGSWNDNVFTAPGFPKVFYLKYHGYDKYFPLWALARYYNEWYNIEPAKFL